jgi:hypothetical protein
MLLLYQSDPLQLGEEDVANDEAFIARFAALATVLASLCALSSSEHHPLCIPTILTGINTAAACAALIETHGIAALLVPLRKCGFRWDATLQAGITIYVSRI